MDATKDGVEWDEGESDAGPDAIIERVAFPRRMISMNEVGRRNYQVNHEEEGDQVLSEDDPVRNVLYRDGEKVS